jgi:uncharacterized protein YacL
MIHVIRVLFIIVIAFAAWAFIWSTLNTASPLDIGPTTRSQLPFNPMPYLIMFGAVIITFAVITIDVLAKRKNLAALSGLMFGILVGVLISLCLSALIDQIANSFLLRPTTGIRDEFELDAIRSANESTVGVLHGIKLLLGIIVTYISTSFVLQTKDDFRFIIPYVEFQRATKGPRPIILDTSVIIDGRIADMAATGLFETTILVPRFVLNELQTIADSSDRLKRARGRRGLEVLEKLKGLPRLELRFWDGTLTNTTPGVDDGVDQKLVSLAQQENGRIVTNDYNLNKVAGLRGVNVININQIADALKPVVLPGETMKVRIVKPGENAGQGVGYLEDGTMVVVEGGRDKVGMEVELVVTNMIQNPAGKMIFGRTDAAGHVPTPKPTEVSGPRRAQVGDRAG